MAADEPDPVGHLRAGAPSEILLLVDHAGRLVPRRLGRLGLAESEFERHIAWDIGALGVATRLSEALEAEMLYQRYSRLVIDCNRPLQAASAFVARSDGCAIEANAALDAQGAAMRVAEIFHPYHAAIASALDQRAARAQPTALVSIHSFTPVHGERPGARPWHIGLLFNRDARLAHTLAALLEAEGDLTVGLNQPYAVDDASDYAIPVHGEARGLVHVEIEIRQDQIATETGQAAWAARLARLLPLALDGLGASADWARPIRATAQAEGEGR
ncbi:MAG: N-formylglutamate amidohydrolase [Pseudomonadota bacterium]